MLVRRSAVEFVGDRHLVTRHSSSLTVVNIISRIVLLYPNTQKQCWRTRVARIPGLGPCV